MLSRNRQNSAESTFLVVTVVLFVALLIVIVILLGYNSLILEWIAAAFLLVTIAALLTILVVDKTSALHDKMHFYKTRQKQREFSLEAYKTRTVNSSHNHRRHY